jgi:cyclopropane-fatty-acyl-phospholipid synthase
MDLQQSKNVGAIDRPTWQEVALHLYHRVVALPRLDVVLPDGRHIRSAKQEAAALLRLRSWRAALALATRDQLALFEAYIDSEVEVEPVDGSGNDEATAFLNAIKEVDEQWQDFRVVTAAIHSSRFIWQQNTESRRAKLAVHYSIPEEFWLAFMSEEYPIYSHYLFEEDESYRHWKRACERKLQFAFDVCQMRPGHKVLNVGEGWGGQLTFAGQRGVHVTGLTLNEASYAASLRKREQEGLTSTCEVVHVDFYNYRSSERFDAITNMGVTEHLTDYDGLMAQYARLLKSGGHVYSDFVGITCDLSFRALIQKHVYPGAAAVYLPKLLAAAEKNGQMSVVATYDDRLSYDKTCVAWARNLETSREFIVSKFGLARYRWMWSYLWMCVHGFRTYGNGITGTRVILQRR